MTNVTAAAVASLRSRTGVSMMQCKKALEEAGGDEEKAIEILRSKGEAQAVKKADREQAEGFIFTGSKGDKTALVTVHCETDFVSRSEDFQTFGSELISMALDEGDAFETAATERVNAAIQQLGENISLGKFVVIEGPSVGAYVHTNGKIGVIVGLDGGSEEAARDVAMHAAAMNPSYVSPEEVPAEDVDKEKEIWKEQLASEGKPAEIMEKIMIGKEKKFREESALITQPFVKNPDRSVQEHLGDATVTEYVRMSV